MGDDLRPRVNALWVAMALANGKRRFSG